MLRKFCLSLLALAALAGGPLLVPAPAQAQGFSVTIGEPGYRDGYGQRPYGYYRPAPPPPYYGGRPQYGYGGPSYYEAPPRRCWNRPVDVWNGYAYVTQLQRVCR